jgi:RNA polymerase sigma factor (sigma-70 family)
MIQDKLLLWKCKQGNRSAFRRIYEKYEGDLRTLAANLLDDKIAAEDVVHDVFVSFLQTVNTFELKSSLAGYLKTCVANKSHDYMRKKKQETGALKGSEPLILDDHWPVKLVIQNEQMQRLCSAMSRLPYEHREAIVLYLHGRMRFKTIARLQKVSTKTAYVRYRAGLDRLKTMLNSEMEK